MEHFISIADGIWPSLGPVNVPFWPAEQLYAVLKSDPAISESLLVVTHLMKLVTFLGKRL